VAVPEIVGAVARVLAVSGDRICTDGGANAVNVVGTDVLPADVAAVTVSVFGPDGSGEVKAQAKVPDAEAVVLHNVTGPGPVIVTSEPGVAVPAITGVVDVSIFTGEVTVTLGGAMAVKLSMAGTDTPPTFWAMAVTEAGPAANVRLEQA
jgi:hypothetical protein